jgi:hypothetical protein
MSTCGFRAFRRPSVSHEKGDFTADYHKMVSFFRVEAGGLLLSFPHAGILRYFPKFPGGDSRDSMPFASSSGNFISCSPNPFRIQPVPESHEI